MCPPAPTPPWWPGPVSTCAEGSASLSPLHLALPQCGAAPSEGACGRRRGRRRVRNSGAPSQDPPLCPPSGWKRVRSCTVAPEPAHCGRAEEAAQIVFQRRVLPG